MNDGRNERPEGGTKVRKLSDAVRKVRIAEAERMDALSDLYDADRARLELLAEDLAPVFADIPKDDDFFICTVAGSVPPRLWVDGTSHVFIGRDRRTYRFVKDTRLGRIVIGESADLQRMADLVTDYVAERIVERDRARDTDFILGQLRAIAAPKSAELDALDQQEAVARSAAAMAIADLEREAERDEGRGSSPVASGDRSHAARRARPGEMVYPTPAPRRSSSVWLLVAFLFGVAMGILLLLGHVWLNTSEF